MSKLKLPLALGAVYVIWGSTFYAIRLAAPDIPALFMSGSRFIAAGLLLFLLLVARGHRLPAPREWRDAAPVGALLFFGGNGMIVVAEAHGVASGMAAMVNATVPLFVAGFAALTRASRPTRQEGLGLLVGAAGAGVLTSGGDVWHAGGGAVLALLAAPMSWSLGTLLLRRAPARDPLMAAAQQMVTGGAVCLVAGAATGERLHALPGPAASAAWLHLVILGSLVGFSAYGWLVAHARHAVATSYAYVNPLFAVLLGATLGGEPITWRLLVAAPLVFASLALVLGPPAPARGRAAATDAAAALLRGCQRPLLRRGP